MFFLLSSIPYNIIAWLFWEDAEISNERMEFIENTVGFDSDPKLIASKYLFYGTDYHENIPERISVKVIKKAEIEIVVEIHNPLTHDDVISQAKDRIYFIKYNNEYNIVRHTWKIKYWRERARGELLHRIIKLNAHRKWSLFI